MESLEKFLKPTQEKLFEMLLRKYSNVSFCEGDFILVEGQAPIMLVAHLDTVHKDPVKFICESKDRNIIMSPQGIGGDDRCGVYALVNAYEQAPIKPYLLFTCNEEVGGIGADYFALQYEKGNLPDSLHNLKLLVEIDRAGKNDAVYYDCANSEFEKYIASKGFNTAHGTFSDISIIAPAMGLAAVNLSSGYYNPHQLCEYINRREINDTLRKVLEIVSDSAKKDFPTYSYVKCEKNGWHEMKTIRETEIQDDIKALPRWYEDYYFTLIDDYGYSIDELEYLRERYGDSIIQNIYTEETGCFYADYENMTVTNIAEK